MATLDDTLMPADYVCHMTRALRDSAAILRGTALIPDELETPNHRITILQNLTCVANAMRLRQPPDWYLAWGSGIGECMHGPLTPAMLSAPTLGDGLDAFVSFFGLRIPYMKLSSCHADEGYEIRLTPRVKVGALLPVLVEIPLLILQRYISLVCGRSINGAEIGLSYRPSPDLGDLHQWFDCEVRFDTRHNTLRIPITWRDARNIGANSSVWKTALSECLDLAEPRQSGLGQRDHVAYIRGELQRLFAGDGTTVTVPSLADVARTLNVSPRTLIRRLRRSDTSYQDEVDAARLRRAVVMLGADNRAVTEVAYSLGYSDPAAFAKAFKRWTGMAPGVYRSAQN